MLKEITRQLQTKDSLHHNLPAVVDNVNEVLWINSPDYKKMIYVSPAFESIWGKTCASLYKNPEAWFLSIHKDDQPAVLKNLKENPFHLNCTYRIVRNDGSIRWIRDRSYPIKNEKGAVVQIAGVALDITSAKAAERELKKSESRYRSLVETIPHGIQEINLHGVITYANAAYHKMHEYAPGKLIGKKVYDLSADDKSKQKLKKYITQVAKFHPKPETYISKGKTKKGRTIVEQVDWNYKRDEKGKVIGFIALITDITERVHTEEALRQSRENYKNLLNIIPYGVIEVDTKLKILYTNQAQYKMLGYKKTNFVGQNSLHWLSTEKEKKRAAKTTKNTVKTQPKPFAYFTQYKKSDGKLIDVQIDWDYRRNHEGEITGFVCIVSDQTKQFAVEKALRDSEEKFRQLAEHIQDVLWMVSPETKKILYISPSYEKIWGKTGQSLYENPDSWMESIHKDDLDYVTKNINKKPTNYDHEYRIIRPDGEVRWIHDRTYPIRNQEGKIYRMAGIARDITDQKKTQKIKTALKEKDALLREIHHRVKNNLQVISSLITLQSNNIKNDKAAKMLLECQGRIESIALIHERLYFQDNSTQIDFSEYLSQLVTQLFSTYGVTSKSIVPKIKVSNLTLPLETAIPCGLIINEAVSNSLKHAFPKPRKGFIEITGNIQKNHMVTFRIKDNGVGISPRLNHKDPDRLGLQLVKGLVKQLDGRLRISRNKGTELGFKFRTNRREEDISRN